MSQHRVYLISMATDSRITGWTQSVRESIKSRLEQLFSQVAATTPLQISVTWQLNACPNDQDVVIYFVLDESRSLISGQSAPTGHGGATFWQAGGMLSEVYVTRTRCATRAASGVGLGNIAFHEALHNRCDAHPRLRLVRDIHRRRLGGGGLAAAVGGCRDPQLTTENIRLMRRGFGVRIPQFQLPRRFSQLCAQP